jgi:hypothetical protein
MQQEEEVIRALLLTPGHAGRGSAKSSCVVFDEKKTPKYLQMQKTNKWLGGGRRGRGTSQLLQSEEARNPNTKKLCTERVSKSERRFNNEYCNSSSSRSSDSTNSNASERERAATREPRSSSAFTYHQLTPGEGGEGREWRFFVITAGTTPASLLTNHLTNLNH